MKFSIGYIVVALLAAAQADTSSTGSLRRKLPSGGSEAASSQVPGFVELKIRNADSKSDKICGGVLIKSDLVATAASCTFAINDLPADSTSQAIVKGPVTATGAGVSRTWEAYSIHPEYVLGSQTNDVALIKLSDPVDGVETVDVHRWSTDAEPGTAVTASGYGQGQTNGGKGVLHMASLSIMQEGNGGCVTGNPASVVCAGSDTQDLCIGDEGAPLINGDNDLVGIYSHGGACEGENGTPKFMRATYFKDFFEGQACELGSYNCNTTASWIGAAVTAVGNFFSNLLGGFGM